VCLDGLTLLEGKIGAAAVDLRFLLAPGSKLFLGHFPGEPILPGIAHLGLALEAAERLGQEAVLLSGVRNFRLRHAVRPGDVVDVRASRAEGPGEVRFEVRVGAVVSSSGVLTLAPRAPRG